jgi:hypothetical protein
MTDRVNDKVKNLVDAIVAECDYNRENWLAYRAQLVGVRALAKTLGYNNKTLRYIDEQRAVVFSLGHGATLK